MKETKFIEQNKEKWLKFEQLLRLNKRDPDKLSDLFVQITDDLSYARTNYPNRTIRVYLNNLAQQLFYRIYKNKKEGKNKFVRFWKEELPSIVYFCRFEMMISLVVFLLAAAIGVTSSIHDPEFTRTILGDSYVDMTIQNIADGDPMGVYKKMNELDMFLGITMNNVLIAFRTFITGIFFSLGSVIILIHNGIMLGSFQYFFIERGLGMESFLTIWLHGTLEISSIIIAGAAGIVLGRGFVFPGTHSRLRAFQLSARRGLKLLLGIVPVLAFAALIESFVTRYTDLPNGIKLTLILVSLIFILFYFVWLPYLKSRNGTLSDIQDRHLQSRNLEVPAFEGVISNVNGVFKNTLLVYRKSLKGYFKVAFFISITYLAGSAYALSSPIKNGLINIDAWVFNKITFLINYQDFPAMFLLNTCLIGVIIYFAFQRAANYIHINSRGNRIILASVLTALLINAPFFFNGILSFMVWITLIPIAFSSAFIYLKEKGDFAWAVGQYKSLISQNFGRITGLYALILFIGFIFFILIDSPFFAFYLEFVRTNFVLEQDMSYYLGLALNGLVIIMGLLLLLPIFLYSFSIHYFNLLEIKEALGLKEQIKNFSKREIK